MAALGKIRSKGKLLLIVIGLALLAFIAGDLLKQSNVFRDTTSVGKVMGKKLKVQEFQKMVAEQTQGQNLTGDDLDNVRDQVWSEYVRELVFGAECEKLGLTVTDDELRNIMKEGTNPMLMQTPFINQQTGRFDENQLKAFLSERENAKKTNPQLAQQYDEVYNQWIQLEKSMRFSLLQQKYEALLGACILSNPVEAKANFDLNNVESQVVVAALPYSSITDDNAVPTDAEIKAQYDKIKASYYTTDELRDVKYIDVFVQASDVDRKQLEEEFAGYLAQLKDSSAIDVAALVGQSHSDIAFLGVPVKKNAYPANVQSVIDSLAVGQTSNVFETVERVGADQYTALNLVKIVSKQNLADSIQYRTIYVDTDERADSVYKAVVAGGDFETIAKVYGQTGAKQWLTVDSYQRSRSFTQYDREMVNSLHALSANESKVLDLGQSKAVVQVCEKKDYETMYQVAVIKKNLVYGDDTRNTAFNNLNSYLAANQNAADLIANAQKSGYNVLDYKNLVSSAHNLAGINSTKDAVKWAFEHKPGEVSEMFSAGDNGNHLVIVALEKVHPAGYLTLDNEMVANQAKALAVNAKKAEELKAKFDGVKDLAAAQSKGAVVDTLRQVTYVSPVFVPALSASEPALAGAVAGTAKGQFSAKPVVGNQGVYVYQVTEKTPRENTYDEKAAKAMLRQRNLQYAGQYAKELFENAKVVDMRYKF